MKANRQRQIITLVTSPSFVMFFLSVLIMTAIIAFIGKFRPFNSDDLYWQQVVRTWTPFSGDIFYFGTKDIFIEQGPFFALMEWLFNPSRRLLIAETIILTVSAFTLFYFSSLYFFKKLKVNATYLNLLPFVWLASFGYPLVQNYLNSDWRTFEVGLTFATFAFVAAIMFGDFRPLGSIRNKILSVLAIILIGVTIYSDPYYVFFGVAPLVLFAILAFALKKINRSTLILIFGGTLLSFVFAKITQFLWEKAGATIVADTPSVFVNFDNIVTNIVSSFHGLLIIFGADFFGRPAFDVATVIAAINALVLGIILYKTYTMRKNLQRPWISKISLAQLWMAFFGLMVVLVFAVYTSTTLVAVNNYRFFIVLVYCAVTFLALSLAVSRSSYAKNIAGAVLVMATLANLYTTFFTNNVFEQGDVKGGNISNSLNYQIIDAVKAEGLTKGYGSYWQGNVNTYLSGGKVVFLPSLCTPTGQTDKFKWLIDGGQFNKKADRSFYIIDPDVVTPPTCTKNQLIAQFGDPQKVINISNKTILIFDYDIASRIKN